MSIIPRIIYDSPEDIVEYFSTANIESLVDIYERIEVGIKNEYADVDVFEVKQSNSNTVLVFNSPKDYWKDNLEWILDILVKREAYENASHVKGIIDKLKEKENEG